MASSTLRAAQAMRSLFLNGSRAFTSRSMTASSIRMMVSQSNVDTNQASQPSQKIMPIEANTYKVADLNENSSSKPDQTSSAMNSCGSSKILENLDRAFSTFEDRCQRNERVIERDFIRTFNTFTKAVESLEETRLKSNSHVMSNIIIYSSLLLRCCGNLMMDTPPKGRELLAGNLWTFIKEKQIPIDVSHYNSLIRVLNENGTNYDPKKILDEMAEQNLSPDRITYQRLIHQYCLQGDIVGATSLLERMKEKDMYLNEATFASLILGYSKQDKPPTTSEMFDLMRSNNIEPNSKSYAAAFAAQAARMATKPDEAVAEITKIFELMQKDEIQFTTSEMVDLINALGPFKKSHEIIEKFFATTLASLDGSVTTRYRILASLVRVNLLDDASRLFWSQSVTERALKTGLLGSYYIRVLATHFNVSADFAVDECAKMEEKGWNVKATQMLYFSAAEAGRTDVVRAALKRLSVTETVKTHYTWPLIAQAKTQEEVADVLKTDLNPGMNQSELLETFSMWVWPKFAEDPTKLFELNKNLKYDANLLIASFLNFCVQNDKVVDAIEFISKAPDGLVNDTEQQSADDDNDADSLITSRRNRPSERSNLVVRLLQQIAEETKDPELVKKAFNMCKLSTEQVSLKTLAVLVRVHLINNDFNKALEEFMAIAREYKMTPLRTELMSHCLVNKDPETLQKIMNTVTEIFGEANSLFDLAVCCLKCGKLKQAQKIFSSPGFRIKPERVYQTCRTLARSGEINILENYVNLTRDMYDINQDYLYSVLIETYKKHDPKRTLHLWNMMQEEEFQPSKRSLFMIASVLEENNIEVPFQKPRMGMQSERNNMRPSRLGYQSSRPRESFDM